MPISLQKKMVLSLYIVNMKVMITFYLPSVSYKDIDNKIVKTNSFVFPSINNSLRFRKSDILLFFKVLQKFEYCDCI